MISIPMWLFVILVILSSLVVLGIILILISIIIALHESEVKIPDYHCPEELDPDYNPEYIPKEERER